VKRTTKFKPNLATARPLPAHFVAALTIAAKPISTHLKGLNAAILPIDKTQKKPELNSAQF
jgi:hypothetical protein